MIIENFDKFFAVPCIFFENTSKVGGPGRSIFTGKIDLFDDLDQCLSQNSNAVRKSTPVEYFNSEYLERDPNTGMPKQPSAYDRTYSIYQGSRNGDGSLGGEPIQVTQPNINFREYTDNAVQILMNIINGVISPATLGIDISRKDNAEAQREKEKMTVFTRNCVTSVESEILRDLCNQLLCGYELMHTGQLTKKQYDISIKFSEFADDSYENKLETLGQAYDAQNISDEMYMNRLYGQSLSKEEFNRELVWLKKNHSAQASNPLNALGGDDEEIEEDDDSEEEEEL
jgi:hypothetical protein